MRGWVCQAMLLLALVVPVLTVPALTVPALAQAPAGNPGATPTERWLLNRLRAPLGRPDFATLSPELAAFFDDPRTSAWPGGRWRSSRCRRWSASCSAVL